MASCPTCGTRTGTHWSGCPHSLQYDPYYLKGGTTTSRISISKPNHRQPIVERTPGEKTAYLEGFEACLKQVKKGLDPHGRQWDLQELKRNVDVASAAAALMKETL